MMQCNRCGRELAEGQTFCLCGCHVDHITGGSMETAIYPGGNVSSGKQKIIVAVVSVIAVILTVAVILWFIMGLDRYRVTHESQWEYISRAEYSMEIPKGMQEGTVIQMEPSMQTLDCFINNEVCITISVLRFTEEQQKIIESMDFTELLMQLFPEQSINGVTLVPVQRDDMIYVQYPRTTSALFPRTDQVWVTDACVIAEESLYEIEISCPTVRYDAYKDCILAWLDSFTLR